MASDSDSAAKRPVLLLVAAVVGVAAVIVLAADPQPGSRVRVETVDSRSADSSSAAGFLSSPLDGSGQVAEISVTEVLPPPSDKSDSPTTTAAPTPTAPTTTSTTTAAPTPTTTSTGVISVDAVEITTGFGQTSTSVPPKGGEVELVAVADSSTKDDIRESVVEGQVYVWHDGDDIRRVVLQPDLTVKTSTDGPTGEIVAKSSVVRSGEQLLPVFRSESGGGIQTLPGGVLVLFVEDWDNARISRFFAEQGIAKSLVSPFVLDNSFKIETEPGFASLALANRLAALEGVELSSPNWTYEVVTK